jgi:hypothetical protein
VRFGERGVRMYHSDLQVEQLVPQEQLKYSAVHCILLEEQLTSWTKTLNCDERSETGIDNLWASLVGTANEIMAKLTKAVLILDGLVVV